MIIPLGIRSEPWATVAATPPEWSVSPSGDLIVGALPRAGATRRLSDLLTGIPEDGSDTSVYLAEVAAARAAVACGENPVLYRAYRDVLAPRAKSGDHVRRMGVGADYWFADLVVYPGGELPGSRELARSVGHWNTAAQLEVFQCLSGRVLLLSGKRDATGKLVLTYQVCRPGDIAVVGFGAWHVTAVLAGPATVFNIYTDTVAHEHSSRDAAKHDELKYHSKAAVRIAVIRTGEDVALTGDPGELRACSPILQISAPEWARSLLGTEGLAAFYQHATDTELARLPRQALIHSQESRVQLARTAR